WSYVWQYKRRGLYYTHLKRYFDRFPREQIKVFLYEDWQAGVDLLKNVLRFLRVDDTVAVPERTVRCNSTDACRFAARGMVRPKFPAELRTRLTGEYREEIEKLQDLIHRDLSAWLLPANGR